MNRDNVIPILDIDSLLKEIECIICLNTANDARMCIHCSVIVCVKCIEDWINQKNLCPKCSQAVQQTDFVKCRLANKLIDFIEISKLTNCLVHAKETPRVYCSTCQNYVCFECIAINGEDVFYLAINHNYKHIDEDHKQILRLNHKLLAFIRKRCKENEDHLNTIELAIQMLFNDHTENVKNVQTDQQTRDSLIKETQCLFDDYQQKKQICNDAITNDQLVLNDVERRLKESRGLSDQEEILRILQKHIPSNVDVEENEK